MCGILGYVSAKHPQNVSECIKMICKMLCISESRGKEATGIAIMNNSEVALYKRAERASKLVRQRNFQKFLQTHLAKGEDGVALIGHSRLVTNGVSSDPNNNQPVVYGNVITVHNGIIVNDAKLRAAHPELKLKSEVDTELFAGLLEAHRDANMIAALKKTYSEISGMASTLTLVADLGYLLAATNNGSLHYCLSDSGDILFASESIGLLKLFRQNFWAQKHFKGTDIKQVAPGTALLFDYASMQMDLVNLNSAEAMDVLEISPGKKSQRTISIDCEPIRENWPRRGIQIRKTNYSRFDIPLEPIQKLQRCSHCVLPETMPFIEFDDAGVCNYCHTYRQKSYAGVDEVRRIADGLRRKDGRADSLVSFSGGRDSCFGLHYFVKELSLHPIAYSYDWGMVTDLARRNQSRLCAKLGIELIIVSADIKNKRENIRKNVTAWLNKPDLGMIPLFMAGDKQYFYYANQICRNYGLDTILMAANPFEETHFKSGFCSVKPSVLRTSESRASFERLPMSGVLRMGGHYLTQFAKNPEYFNASLLDTVGATLSYYVIPHNYFRLFNYIPWNEQTVNSVLLNEYDWETSPDTHSTWRIGDGTAPFYNYIYYRVAGFTENDTLRSNQIREGMLSREEALRLVYRDNLPRFESLEWYFNAIGLNMEDVLVRIAQIPPLYPVNN